MSYRGEGSAAAGPEVVLRSDFAGRENEWSGTIVRTEGEIDPRSRMVHAVARVRDPYSRKAGSANTPLAAGMFVDAEILGHHVEDAVVLPRSALHGEDTVYVITEEERLVFRQVGVLRLTSVDVVIGAGLTPGEQVCMSPLEAVTDGMHVRINGRGSAASAAVNEEPAT
jgi:multidrug efflux pump subunit AcrA (membrane-fusion protein)